MYFRQPETMYRDRITLVTTVYNEEENILSFLYSYLSQSIHADEFIIVDGGSTDKTPDIIKEFERQHPELHIHLIIDKTCSKTYSIAPIAKGRNVAIQHAKSEFIAVTDAGCRLHKDWLKEITYPLLNKGANAVCGYYTVNMESDYEKKYGVLFQPEENKILPSSRSIAFRKKVWKDVGMYPERSYTAEDTLFDLNILKAGYTFVHAPKALVSWTFATSEADLFKKLKEYGKGEGRLLIYKRKALFRLVCLFLPIFLIAFRLLRNKPSHFKVSYIFYYHQTIGYIQGIWSRFRK